MDYSYIIGLFDMISYNLQPSYIDINFIKKYDDIYKEYNISKDKQFIKRDNNKDFFKNLFCVNDKELDHFKYLITKELGEVKNIYEPSNEILDFLSNDNSKYKFFFLEDMYVKKKKKIFVCLLIGNDE